jgi:hypothetical protein
MSLEVFGIRALSMDEWECVSGGAGLPPDTPPPGSIVGQAESTVASLIGLVEVSIGANGVLASVPPPTPCDFNQTMWPNMELDLSQVTDMQAVPCGDQGSMCWTYTSGDEFVELPPNAPVNGAYPGGPPVSTENGCIGG